jgi:hypothetical protein
VIICPECSAAGSAETHRVDCRVKLRLDRIAALSPEQMSDALMFLASWAAPAIDVALARVGG